LCTACLKEASLSAREKLVGVITKSDIVRAVASKEQ